MTHHPPRHTPTCRKCKRTFPHYLTVHLTKRKHYCIPCWEGIKGEKAEAYREANA